MPRRFNRRSRFRRPRRRRFVRRRRRSRRRRVVVDPERKVLTTVNGGGTPTLLTWNALQVLINGAPQGLNAGDRQGFQSLALSVDLQYYLSTPGPAPGFAPPVMVKIALVLFKQPRGVLLNTANVWEGQGTIFAPISHRDLGEALAYKVLWSRTHRLSGVDIPNLVRKVHKKLHLRTRYSTVNATFQDITSGALYLVAFSDQDTNTFEPALTFQARVRFVG